MRIGFGWPACDTVCVLLVWLASILGLSVVKDQGEDFGNHRLSFRHLSSVEELAVDVVADFVPIRRNFALSMERTAHVLCL